MNYEHKIIIKPEFRVMYVEMLEWCYDNFGQPEERWDDKIIDVKEFGFSFKNSSDATVFALRWL